MRMDFIVKFISPGSYDREYKKSLKINPFLCGILYLALTVSAMKRQAKSGKKLQLMIPNLLCRRIQNMQLFHLNVILNKQAELSQMQEVLK